MILTTQRSACGVLSVIALVLLGACSEDPASDGNGNTDGACPDGSFHNGSWMPWSTCAAGTPRKRAP